VKKVSKDHFVSLNGMLVPLNVTEDSGCYIEVMEAAQRQLEAMQSHHRDVFVVYFLIQCPSYTSANAPISRFMKSLGKRILTSAGRRTKKRYQFRRYGYLWVREKETAAAQHYHVALMLDGKQIQNSIYLLQEYLQPAAESAEVTVSVCEGLDRVVRGDEDSYGACLKRVSYSAKERGKGARKAKAKDFSSGFRDVESKAAVKPRSEACNPVVDSGHSAVVDNDVNEPEAVEAASGDSVSSLSAGCSGVMRVSPQSGGAAKCRRRRHLSNIVVGAQGVYGKGRGPPSVHISDRLPHGGRSSAAGLDWQIVQLSGCPP